MDGASSPRVAARRGIAASVLLSKTVRRNTVRPRPLETPGPQRREHGAVLPGDNATSSSDLRRIGRPARPQAELVEKAAGFFLDQGERASAWHASGPRRATGASASVSLVRACLKGSSPLRETGERRPRTRGPWPGDMRAAERRARAPSAPSAPEVETVRHGGVLRERRREIDEAKEVLLERRRRRRDLGDRSTSPAARAATFDRAGCRLVAGTAQQAEHGPGRRALEELAAANLVGTRPQPGPSRRPSAPARARRSRRPRPRPPEGDGLPDEPRDLLVGRNEGRRPARTPLQYRAERLLGAAPTWNEPAREPRTRSEQELSSSLTTAAVGTASASGGGTRGGRR